MWRSACFSPGGGERESCITPVVCRCPLLPPYKRRVGGAAKRKGKGKGAIGAGPRDGWWAGSPDSVLAGDILVMQGRDSHGPPNRQVFDAYGIFLNPGLSS